MDSPDDTLVTPFGLPIELIAHILFFAAHSPTSRGRQEKHRTLSRVCRTFYALLGYPKEFYLDSLDKVSRLADLWAEGPRERANAARVLQVVAVSEGGETASEGELARLVELCQGGIEMVDFDLGNGGARRKDLVETGDPVGSTLGGALKGCSRLRTFKFSLGAKGMVCDAAVFERLLPHWPNLRILALAQVPINSRLSSPAVPPSALPTGLRALTIQSSHTASGPVSTFLPALLFSSASTLRTLRILNCCHATDRTVLAALTPLLPTLKDLAWSPTPAELVPLLPKMASLEHVEVNFDEAAASSTDLTRHLLLVPVTHLTVGVWDAAIVQQLRRLVRKSGTLKSLRILHIRIPLEEVRAELLALTRTAGEKSVAFKLPLGVVL